MVVTRVCPARHRELDNDKDLSPMMGYSQIEKLKERLRIKVDAIKSNRCESTEEEERKSISKRAARRAEKLRRTEKTTKESCGITSNINRYSQSDINKSPMKGIEKNPLSMKVKGTTDHLIGEIGSDVRKDLAGIDFGAITGLKHIPQNKNNKSLTNLGKKISLEKLLADAEAKKQRLTELQSSERVEKKDEAIRIQWRDMLETVSGVHKKHRSVAQLKKKIKIKNSLKARSEKAWKSRNNCLKSKNSKRQKVLRHMTGPISVSDSVCKESVNEPSLGNHSRNNRAGFEGRRHEFLNKKGVMSKNKGAIHKD